MLLRSVRLENFRAVKSAKLSLDATTVLIGENDCGRTSILEAVALALGWQSGDCEFHFQPAHFPLTHARGSETDTSHRAATVRERVHISITLEFRETTAGEWDAGAFDLLRTSLPGAARERSFWFEVTHDGETRWLFRSAHGKPLVNDSAMLAWLRQRMPVFWMREGMMASGQADPIPEAGGGALADQVRQEYRDLLQGTALDITAAIERGAAAAHQLLRARLKPGAGSATPFTEVLEEIIRKRNQPPVRMPPEAPGTAAQKIGVLLLAGGLLRAGAAKLDEGVKPLALIENPEAHLHPMTVASIWGVIEGMGGQKIIATHSGELLSRARLASVRRLTRHAGVVKEWRVPKGALTADELRRYSYHVRSRRAAASFARCWLLVEGETEFWLMNELARVCGYDLASEGVACVEFAQCGLDPLIKVARHLGIEWYVLADGDPAGRQYACSAAKWSEGETRIALLEDADIEHCFWSNGYADVFRKAAYPGGTPVKRPVRAVVARAIERYSKPHMAALLLDSVISRGPEGVPPPLRQTIETCVQLARRSVGMHHHGST
jgi:putative ATP-dependent endonuclease of OLD family